MATTHPTVVPPALNFTEGSSPTSSSESLPSNSQATSPPNLQIPLSNPLPSTLQIPSPSAVAPLSPTNYLVSPQATKAMENTGSKSGTVEIKAQQPKGMEMMSIEGAKEAGKKDPMRLRGGCIPCPNGGCCFCIPIPCCC